MGRYKSHKRDKRKSYATYDAKLTKQKLDLTEKIENVERKITHSTHAQKWS